MAKGDKLTPKQERFCLNIFQGMSQREAYIKAGYSSKQGIGPIDRNSCILANSNKIIKRLSELKQAAEDESIATVQERKQILSDIARASLPDFLTDGGEVKIHNVKHNKALSEYAITYTKKGEQRKEIKLHDPVRAISELNKMERIGAQEGDGSIKLIIQRIVNNLQVNNISIEQLSDDELKMLAMGQVVEE